MGVSATLEVMTGDRAGDRHPVPAGAAVRVGRVPPAEVLIPDDPLLSGLHFAVECGPGGCRVRDLGSRFGTFRRGERVTDAPLRDGDEILAGRSRFGVSVAGAADGPDGDGADVPTPAPATTPVPAGLRPVPPDRAAVRDWLAGLDGLYAILDAAQEPSIPERLAKSGEEHLSLFDGDQGKLLAPYGPWLVRLSGRSGLLDELVAEGWGNNWGVYLTCDRPPAEVRRHLRKFLMVKLPDGRQVYFRYYDPRVLRTYLPTCTPEELAVFLGPIGRYVGEDGVSLQEFRAGGRNWCRVGQREVARG